jgi:hypothetical protein
MAISGKTGTVTLGSGTICASEWSVNFEMDRLDASCFTSDGWKEFVAGLKSVTGSVTSFDDPGSLDPTALVGVTLANDDISFSGSAFLNLAVTTPVAGLVENVYDVQFSGSVTVT